MYVQYRDYSKQYCTVFLKVDERKILKVHKKKTYDLCVVTDVN